MAALDAERMAAVERETLLARRDVQLKESFQALSADVLAQNNETFVALAEGRIKEATAALTAKAEGETTARAQAKLDEKMRPPSRLQASSPVSDSTCLTIATRS